MTGSNRNSYPAAIHAATEFAAIWDPAADPHLEIVGLHSTGKTAAVASIAATVIAQGGEVRPIAHSTLTSERRRTPDEIEQALRDVARELSVRYSLLEEPDSVDGERRPQLPLMLVVIDEFDDHGGVHTDPQQRARLRGHIRELLAVGPAARIHLVVCSTTPQFTTGDERSMVSHVALGPLTSHARQLLDPRRTGAAPRPIGSGWFFRQAQPVVPVRF